MKLITDAQVGEKLGIARVTVWRRIKELPDFPKPIRPDGGRTTRWVESEVDDYIRQQIKKARGG